jgi:hypothetical protein
MSAFDPKRIISASFSLMISVALTVGEYRFDSRMFSDVRGGSRHSLNCEPLLVVIFRVALHFFQRQMTGPSRDFMRAATSIGQSRASGCAESMKRAALRQSSFVAPCAKLPAEFGRPKWLARILDKEREVFAWCRVDDRAEAKRGRG